MGATISNLVFRPPRPTNIKPDRFFYIEVEPPDDSHYSAFSCNPTSCVPDAKSVSSSDDTNDTNDEANKNEAPQQASTSHVHRIPAFFLLRRGAKITLLYSHGNAEDLGMMYRRMKELARVLCVNVLAYDYSGYGLSQPRNSKPTEALCYRNIEAAYGYLTNVLKIPPSQIVLYGRSLGSGPSCHLAKKTADEGNSVAGLILHSPFLSIYRIVLDVKSKFVGDMFQSFNLAKDVRCPVLVIHGREDAVVPFWHGDELLRSFQPEYRAQPFFVPEMGHNNIEVRKRQEYVMRVQEFFTKYIENQTTDTDQDWSGGNEKSTKRNVVPVHERYMPEWSLKKVGKNFVNQTWVKHGPTIVNNARAMNASANARNKMNAKTTTNKNVGSTATSSSTTKPTSSGSNLPTPRKSSNGSRARKESLHRDGRLSPALAAHGNVRRNSVSRRNPSPLPLSSQRKNSFTRRNPSPLPTSIQHQNSFTRRNPSPLPTSSLQHQNSFSRRNPSPSSSQQHQQYRQQISTPQRNQHLRTRSTPETPQSHHRDHTKTVPLKRNSTNDLIAKILQDESDNDADGPSIERTKSDVSRYIETQESWATEEDINNMTFESVVQIGGTNVHSPTKRNTGNAATATAALQSIERSNSPLALAAGLERRQQRQQSFSRSAASPKNTSGGNHGRQHSENIPLDNLTNHANMSTI
eukprot:CAMPEP_0194089890 /NCGR_PEP_ID=MMETSP0149-20130528/36637_1 /TAXON_ID=122233 /ORGANISM="Chaetoceros debilis, Strain MM31A-1" /LENGTH=690 /DNA_ID=CAMNT_0038773977 /DNA_START=340 /DNA_END=2412 /DNA_ORIENTATION=+